MYAVVGLPHVSEDGALRHLAAQLNVHDIDPARRRALHVDLRQCVQAASGAPPGSIAWQTWLAVALALDASAVHCAAEPGNEFVDGIPDTATTVLRVLLRDVVTHGDRPEWALALASVLHVLLEPSRRYALYADDKNCIVHEIVVLPYDRSVRVLHTVVEQLLATLEPNDVCYAVRQRPIITPAATTVCYEWHVWLVALCGWLHTPVDMDVDSDDDDDDDDDSDDDGGSSYSGSGSDDDDYDDVEDAGLTAATTFVLDCERMGTQLLAAAEHVLGAYSEGCDGHADVVRCVQLVAEVACRAFGCLDTVAPDVGARDCEAAELMRRAYDLLARVFIPRALSVLTSSSYTRDVVALVQLALNTCCHVAATLGMLDAPHALLSLVYELTRHCGGSSAALTLPVGDLAVSVIRLINTLSDDDATDATDAPRAQHAGAICAQPFGDGSSMLALVALITEHAVKLAEYIGLTHVGPGDAHTDDDDDDDDSSQLVLLAAHDLRADPQTCALDGCFAAIANLVATVCEWRGQTPLFESIVETLGAVVPAHAGATHKYVLVQAVASAASLLNVVEVPERVKHALVQLVRGIEPIGRTGVLAMRIGACAALRPVCTELMAEFVGWVAQRVVTGDVADDVSYASWMFVARALRRIDPGLHDPTWRILCEWTYAVRLAYPFTRHHAEAALARMYGNMAPVAAEAVPPLLSGIADAVLLRLAHNIRERFDQFVGPDAIASCGPGDMRMRHTLSVLVARLATDPVLGSRAYAPDVVDRLFWLTDVLGIGSSAHLVPNDTGVLVLGAQYHCDPVRCMKSLERAMLHARHAPETSVTSTGIACIALDFVRRHTSDSNTVAGQYAVYSLAMAIQHGLNELCDATSHAAALWHDRVVVAIGVALDGGHTAISTNASVDELRSAAHALLARAGMHNDCASMAIARRHASSALLLEGCLLMHTDRFPRDILVDTNTLPQYLDDNEAPLPGAAVAHMQSLSALAAFIANVVQPTFDAAARVTHNSDLMLLALLAHILCPTFVARLLSVNTPAAQNDVRLFAVHQCFAIAEACLCIVAEHTAGDKGRIVMRAEGIAAALPPCVRHVAEVEVPFELIVQRSHLSVVLLRVVAIPECATGLAQCVARCIALITEPPARTGRALDAAAVLGEPRIYREPRLE